MARSTPSAAAPLLSEAMLADLVASGVVEAVTIPRTPDGFVVSVRFGSVERDLGNARGGVKTFASLDTVAAQLLRLGIEEFVVKAGGYKPARAKGPSTEKTKAMRDADKQRPKKGGVTP